MKRFALLALVAACGGDDTSSTQSDASVDGSGSAATDAAVDSPMTGGMLTLTSPMVTEGTMIAAAYSCDGTNASPQLVWTGSAMGALSYAVVLTDKTNGVLHWVIYDIPASATGLPAAVEKVYAPTNVAGAHQTTSYLTTTRGYLGPCPQANDGPHTYEFALYGVDVATLPGTSMTTTRAQAVPLITQHMTAKATLTGTFDH